MPVRREPLLAAVLPALPRADANAERLPPKQARRPRVVGARASMEDVKAAAAELHERDGRS